ncbi:hypothetical protein DFO61_3365 [Ectopseudomonas oleovorans]|uniref:Uncharacterized protein n=1 Tax=Ectopseudomonas oleovorans TaxID=301 RepID=A0A397MK16_ECTOL|nr:hypothetical protein [Pseudomonas oleovorans]RIA22675.1 hypothetical protein DFO61_3365 [Pseudomonas oleovorans]
MSETHIYEGTGSPRVAGLYAPRGSHYIDSERSDRVWIATYDEPGDEGGFTEWVMLEERVAPFVSSGGYTYPFHADATAYVLMLGAAAFSISEVSAGQTVYSNVEFESGGAGVLQYASETPFLVRVEPVSAEAITVIVTPLTAQTA